MSLYVLIKNALSLGLKEERIRKMKKNKPRTAVNRKVNKLLSTFGNKCEWWDDGYTECMLPWSNKNENGCNGNPFICKKLYYKYLASVEKSSQNIIDEFDRRKMNNKEEDKDKCSEKRLLDE